MGLDVKHLGQVFTPDFIVDKMVGLVKNNGRVLEPACGDGVFVRRFANCVAIEIDENICPDSALNMDFFDYSTNNEFDTIIGNPPYVRFQDIDTSTKSKLDMSLFDERTNLYLFFIHKCLQHLSYNGELIFIVPRDWLKATSAIKLNELLYSAGTITDIIDLGDGAIFDGACPNCVIFRFEKNNFSRVCNLTQKFRVVNGQMLFVSGKYTVPLNDLFSVKVGAVSGADDVFVHPDGNLDFVCSKTCKTGALRRMLYNINVPYLQQYKDRLINRKIRKFNDENWYMWGRDYHKSDAGRVYVNMKTRNQKPFFYNSCKAYDGSVLAIFPKFECDEKMLKQIADDFNDVDWAELGFVCDGRFLFSQKSLENILLPETFAKYLFAQA